MARAFDRQHGHARLGGLSRVFHCNHYNAYLQMAVLLSEDVKGCDPEALLSDAMVPLIRALREEGYSQEELLEEFSFCGFGKLRPLLNEQWVTPSSHYGQAALMHGKKRPSCFFTQGYLTGMTDLHYRENQCKQQGAPVDWFKPEGELARPPAPYLIHPAPFTEVPARFAFDGCEGFKTRIDEDGIIQAVAGLPLYGKAGKDDTGLIDAFGVVLTNHFADYYNRISYQSYFAMLEGGMSQTHTRDVFIQGGHICAFNTFGGIMSSPEWYQLIAPLCESDGDWVHGMVAVINALGWGVWRVERIVPGEELVIRIYNSYEGIGFRMMYPPRKEKNISFLNLGAVQGLAHLLWKIDIRDRPTLDHDFYASTFNNPQDSFSVEQTHAIAAGDGYDRIVAIREK
jgi:hypothetical protein